ncbi:MAG: hypothetical protein M3Q69_04755 [Acidobacteriota bacterium]|nr:hypothetical protein [Acidobacteriota bacterium]
MKMRDEVQASRAGRELLLVRAVRAALAALSWTTREGVTHGGGMVDVAAEREWTRSGRTAYVHLLAHCYSGTRVLFSKADRGKAAVPSYSLGDDDSEQRRVLTAAFGAEAVEKLHRGGFRRGRAVTARSPIAAPNARVHAAAFRDEESFASVANAALSSIDHVLHDLFTYDHEVITDDLTDGTDEDLLFEAASRRHLVHAIVVTDAALWTVEDERRIARVNAVRLHRGKVVGAEERWIDVIHATAFADHANAVTNHYSRFLR